MIVFMVPDYHKPSGGIDLIYTLASYATELGHETVIWHGLTAPTKREWTRKAPKVLVREVLVLKPGDILIVPEHQASKFSQLTRHANIVLLVQGHHLLLEGAPTYQSNSEVLPGWPQTTVAIGTSRQIIAALNQLAPPSLPKHYIPCPIAPEFKALGKTKSICFMPRKRAGEVKSVISLIKTWLPDWELAPIDNVTRFETAAIMGRSAIFLSFSDKEGFGLPPAEAMAAGCYVVGYTGDGGQEYMNPEYCSPIADQDVFAFASETVKIAREFETEPDTIAAKTARARACVIENYNSARFEAAARTVLDEITRDGSPCRQTENVRVFHYTWTKKNPVRQLRRFLKYGVISPPR